MIRETTGKEEKCLLKWREEGQEGKKEPKEGTYNDHDIYQKTRCLTAIRSEYNYDCEQEEEKRKKRRGQKYPP